MDIKGIIVIGMGFPQNGGSLMSKSKMILLACAVATLVSGCATSEAVAPSKPVEHKDGTIASMRLVNIKGQNPTIKVYEMFYWSDGEKAEAVVSLPKTTGQKRLPLYIYCHGGYTAPMPSSSHVTSMDGVRITPIPQDFSRGTSSQVLLEPEYRGYSQSQGTVGGIYDNAVDTENAIAAIESLNKIGKIYLWGASMGGGVALMVGSNPVYASKINAIAAMSPFVGWDIVMQWAQKHKKSNQEAQSYIGEGRTLHLEQNSPDVSKIVAPVLLLQGTGDRTIPWQTVNALYNQMKSDGKTVQLDLFPNGNHYLSGKYQEQSIRDVAEWFKKY